MSLFLGNRGTKLYKLEDKNIASKFIRRGKNKENVWEQGNKDPPGRRSLIIYSYPICMRFMTYMYVGLKF